MKGSSWGKRRGEEGKENGAKIFKFRTPEAWWGSMLRASVKLVPYSHKTQDPSQHNGQMRTEYSRNSTLSSKGEISGAVFRTDKFLAFNNLIDIYFPYRFSLIA